MSSALLTVRKFFPNVKVVRDAKFNATVEVTAQDVSSSKKKKHAECAMAVACKRKFHLDGVIISKSIAYLVKSNKARRFQVPESIAREVVSFDRGSGFTPGKYSLSAPCESNTLDARERRRKEDKRKNHQGKSKRPTRMYHRTENVRMSLNSAK
jgi:hypothetical protein